MYSHDNNNKEDDQRFLQTIFKRYSEQAWDKTGKPVGDTKVLSKKNAMKFSKDVLANWKKLSEEENESYIN